MPLMRALGRLIQWFWSPPSRPSSRASLLRSVEPRDTAVATMTPKKSPNKPSAVYCPTPSTPLQEHEQSPEQDKKGSKLPTLHPETQTGEKAPNALTPAGIVEKVGINGTGEVANLPESEKKSTELDNLQDGEKEIKGKKRTSKSSSSSRREQGLDVITIDDDDAIFFDLLSVGAGAQAFQNPTTWRNMFEVVFVDDKGLKVALAKQIVEPAGKFALDRTPVSSASTSVDLAVRDGEGEGEAAGIVDVEATNVASVGGGEGHLILADGHEIISAIREGEGGVTNNVHDEGVKDSFAGDGDGLQILADGQEIVSNITGGILEAAKEEEEPIDEPAMEMASKMEDQEQEEAIKEEYDAFQTGGLLEQNVKQAEEVEELDTAGKERETVAIAIDGGSVQPPPSPVSLMSASSKDLDEEYESTTPVGHFQPVTTHSPHSDEMAATVAIVETSDQVKDGVPPVPQDGPKTGAGEEDIIGEEIRLEPDKPGDAGFATPLELDQGGTGPSAPGTSVSDKGIEGGDTEEVASSATVASSPRRQEMGDAVDANAKPTRATPPSSPPTVSGQVKVGALRTPTFLRAIAALGAGPNAPPSAGTRVPNAPATRKVETRRSPTSPSL